MIRKPSRLPLEHLLFRPVDASSLALFRVAFGALLIWEVQKYFDNDRIRRYWLLTEWNFPYEWFPWVRAWPGPGMFIHFLVLAVAAFLMMIGLWYRAAAAVVFLTFAFVFLSEQAIYLNHYYLIVLISFLMVLVPANAAYSVDALRAGDISGTPVPAWAVLVLRFQMGVVYFFGAIAKLNYDWLVLGQPMRGWLSRRLDFPVIGQYFTIPWVPHLMGVAGLLIDLLAPFLLLVRRARPFMFAALVAFHFMNDRLFRIGIFPWLGIAASTLFLPPDWPRRLAAELRRSKAAMLLGAAVSTVAGLYFHGRFDLVPALIAALAGAVIVWSFLDAFGRPAESASPEPAPASLGLSPRTKRLVAAFLLVWVTYQTLMPLRHLLIPGDVAWTEEGHRFSWRMKLRAKSGYTTFYAYNPTTRRMLSIKPDTILAQWQQSEMEGDPQMINEFARFLGQRLREAGMQGYEIRAISFATLNYGPPKLLIGWDVDLSSARYSDFRRNPWIRGGE